MTSVELINYVIYVQITLGKKIIICCSMCVIWQYSSIPQSCLGSQGNHIYFICKFYMKMRISLDQLLIMQTIVFRTNIDILTFFHFLHSAIATLLILRLRILRYFPYSPISIFRKWIPQKQKRNAVAQKNYSCRTRNRSSLDTFVTVVLVFWSRLSSFR